VVVSVSVALRAPTAWGVHPSWTFWAAPPSAIVIGKGVITEKSPGSAPPRVGPLTVSALPPSSCTTNVPPAVGNPTTIDPRGTGPAADGVEP
jgi:hypothetical protein